MGIAVTVLGSAAMFATVERQASGYLVEYEDTKLWIDAGGGTWRQLLQFTDHRDVDGILLTHRHPDHTIDVFQALHARLYGEKEPLPPIPLWAPAETLERLLAFSSEIARGFDLHVIAEGESMEADGAKLSFVRMAHPPETLGVRIEHEGIVVAYSADTGPNADFRTLAGDAALFVCEATFQDSDEEWEGHLRASQAGAAAAESGAGKLLLTHLPPGRDLGLSLAEAQKSSGDVEVQLAADGLRLEVTG